MTESDTTAVLIAGGGGVNLLTINGFSVNMGAATGLPYLYVFDLNTTTGVTAGGDWIMKLPIGANAATPATPYPMTHSWASASLAKGLAVLLVPAGNEVSLTIEFA
jgi:hypothetical protein